MLLRSHPPGAMATGWVDFSRESGGYGFIETDDAEEGMFFHMEDIGGPDLEEGQEVEFDLVQADKCPPGGELDAALSGGPFGRGHSGGESEP